MTVQLKLSKKAFTPKGAEEPREYFAAVADVCGELIRFDVKPEDKKLLKYLLKDMEVTEED